MSSGRCSPSRAAIVVTVVTLGLVTTAVVVHKLSKANQEEDPAQSGAWYDPPLARGPCIFDQATYARNGRRL